MTAGGESSGKRVECVSCGMATKVPHYGQMIEERNQERIEELDADARMLYATASPVANLIAKHPHFWTIALIVTGAVVIVAKVIFDLFF